MNAVITGSRHETADDYAGTIAHLDERHRVAICKDGIQWILQRRENGTAKRPWRGLHYCQTRKALVRVCGAACRAPDPEAMNTLAELPEHIGRASGGLSAADLRIRLLMKSHGVTAAQAQEMATLVWGVKS